MSECAEMQKLKAEREEQRGLAKRHGPRFGFMFVNKALDLTRMIGNHWDGCNECQGLAVVEQEPAVDESCSECQPGPGEVSE